MTALTPSIITQLLAAAEAAAEKAYAPYSGFRVGAALLFNDGDIATGCNVENISYGLSICAERTALVRAIAEKGSARRIDAVLVTNLNGTASSPCGACLQVLSEFVMPEAMACFAANNGLVQKPFRELIPFAFSDWKKENDARR
jgi:cytidine deaminase